MRLLVDGWLASWTANKLDWRLLGWIAGCTNCSYSQAHTRTSSVACKAPAAFADAAVAATEAVPQRNCLGKHPEPFRGPRLAARIRTCVERGALLTWHCFGRAKPHCPGLHGFDFACHRGGGGTFLGRPLQIEQLAGVRQDGEHSRMFEDVFAAGWQRRCCCRDWC